MGPCIVCVAAGTHHNITSHHITYVVCVAQARIIVSHVSGASFVRKELGDNPNTVRNTMPFLSSMQQIASRLGMQVVLPSFLGTEPEAIEQALEAFYLVIFVRGGSDADDAAEGSNVLELPVGLQQSDLLK